MSLGKKELSLLVCPFCGSKFHLNKKVSTVTCSCDEYPILDNILFLHKSKAKKIVKFLHKNQKFKALCQAFDFGYLKSLLFILFIHLNKIFNISPKNIINIVFLNLIWKINPNEIKYYFNRQKETESLLFFTPLSFCKINPSTWLDVGSGINNYYKDLHKIYPKLTIISVESIFRNIFLSLFFFPRKKVVYLCTDFSYGPHFLEKSIDIVTFIDSLPFIQQQKRSIQIVIEKIIKKNGLFFISNIIDPLHPTGNNYSFPISAKIIRNWFGKNCQLFDDITLCKNIFFEKLFEKSLLSFSESPQFRYSLLWPIQKLPKKLILPQNISKKGLTIWQNTK